MTDDQLDPETRRLLAAFHAASAASYRQALDAIGVDLADRLQECAAPREAPPRARLLPRAWRLVWRVARRGRPAQGAPAAEPPAKTTSPIIELAPSDFRLIDPDAAHKE